MHSLSDFQDLLDPNGPLCALQVIAQMLSRAARYQLLAYMHGEYDELPTFGALIQLHGLVRYGVCMMTRVLDENEMPSLSRLLVRLPDHARAYLEVSLAAEKTGQCAHGPARWGRDKAGGVDKVDNGYHSPGLAPLELLPGALTPELSAFEDEFMRRYDQLKSLLPHAPLAEDPAPHHLAGLPLPLLVPEPLELQGQELQGQELLSSSSSGSRWRVGGNEP